MSLPPIKISDEVQKQAYEDLAKGSMRQFGDALTVMVSRVLSPRVKSAEEIALDWHHGEEESENRRRLATEALDRIPFARRMLPAPQIAGRVFRDSEFETPGTPIWEMWSQLLSRACDSERVQEAHPAYLTLIGQLAVDEALILSTLAPHTPESWEAVEARSGPFARHTSADLRITFPRNLRLYRVHLDSLGLTFQTNLSGYKNGLWIDDQVFCHLTEFGHSFIQAVTPASAF